jgi:Restriction endonuclease NaeI
VNLPVVDAGLEVVLAEIKRLDPDGRRAARVIRDTLDQLYDGQRTGRYRWDQLHKTEKTHCGTLIEINLHREFDFGDGRALDYLIAGEDVDCKYSQTVGGWMIPPEAHSHLCLVLWADDVSARWSMGLVRTSPDRLNTGGNRDKKATLNAQGRASIEWIFERESLPPNILLQLPRPDVDRIMGMRHGTQRLNELFRCALGMRVGRGVVATVAQQDDYMKRVRANGGARTALKPEGILILGQFSSHSAVANALGVAVPGRGESVAVRVSPAFSPGPGVAEIAGRLWRVAHDGDPRVVAPDLPER